MCGIAGLYKFGGAQVQAAEVRGMTDWMTHRGPNSGGAFVNGSVGLGIRRLSVIDPAGGDQPITNEDSTKWVVFNGEIYNHLDVRQQLESKGHRFRTKTDTECIVHAYEDYGLDCIEHLRGMFAFALWDKNRRRLFIARDRIGIKPLYYWIGSRELVFASEIKALLAHPKVVAEPNPPGLYQYLVQRFADGAETGFKDIHKLLPGHYILVENDVVSIHEYWNIVEECYKTTTSPRRSEQDLAEELRGLLDSCVRSHLISDVPLGAFLSGGLDSSSVVAMMARHSTGPVKTYSVGFEGEGASSELGYAREVATLLGTEHHEFVCSAPEFDVVHQVVRALEEPIVDAAAIPTFLLSELAVRDVTVVLTGEGSDETNGGYSKYRAPQLARTWPDRFLQYIPSSLRREVMFGCARKSGSAVRRIERRLAYSLAGNGSFDYIDTELGWKSEALGIFSADFLATLNNRNPVPPTRNDLPLEQAFFYRDIQGWLVNDLLLKVDKTTMAHSLEARVPFLDHEYVKFAMSLPWDSKLNSGQTKALLRKAMRSYLPDGIRYRNQHGFTVPLQQWLTTKWKSPVLDLLNSKAILERGYFDTSVLKDLASRLVNDQAGVSSLLLAVLINEIWHKEFCDRRSALCLETSAK